MLMAQAGKLHVVSFDVPYPTNYGGVIDVYYKCKALKEIGLEIILHCFQYGERKPQKHLREIFPQTYYYPRKTGLAGWSPRLPYIIHSRRSKQLLQRLAADDHPILFEGLHCCSYLGHHKLASSRQFVRMHNIEWQYYQHLGARESQFFKSLYYKRESQLLQTYEKKLHKAHKIMAISKNDRAYLNQNFKNTSLIPAFHPFNQVISKPGKGRYMLYHGNLSVNENLEAANFLLHQLEPIEQLPLIIAGANPPQSLKQQCNERKVKLIANPSHEALNKLIQEAQVNVLPTFQDTGIKLKLLSALYQGRFCLVNPPMVEGTGLEKLCMIAKTARDFNKQIHHIQSQEYTQVANEQRAKTLYQGFSNQRNAQQLLNCLSPQKD